MNPYSQDAIAGRQARHLEAVGARNELLAQAEADPGRPDLARALRQATVRVRGSLARIEAMGDPLPKQTSIPTVSVSRSLTEPPAPGLAPLAPAATHTRKPELAADPIEVLAARILKA